RGGEGARNAHSIWRTGMCGTIALLLALGCASTDGTAEAAKQTLVLKSARVFDGVAEQPHQHWVVVVQGDRIDSAGPAADITIPANARILDLAGMTLLPGL